MLRSEVHFPQWTQMLRAIVEGRYQRILHHRNIIKHVSDYRVCFAAFVSNASILVHYPHKHVLSELFAAHDAHST